VEALRGAIRLWIRISEAAMWPDGPDFDFEYGHEPQDNEIVALLVDMYSIDELRVWQVLEQERAKLKPLRDVYEERMEAERQWREERRLQREAEERERAEAEAAEQEKERKARVAAGDRRAETIEESRARWAREREAEEDRYKEKG
jgi:hypothetical protein